MNIVEEYLHNLTVLDEIRARHGGKDSVAEEVHLDGLDLLWEAMTPEELDIVREHEKSKQVRHCQKKKKKLSWRPAYIGITKLGETP